MVLNKQFKKKRDPDLLILWPNCNIALTQALAPGPHHLWRSISSVASKSWTPSQRPLSVQVHTSHRGRRLYPTCAFLVTRLERFHSQLPPRLPPVFHPLTPSLNHAAPSLTSSGINHVPCVSGLMGVRNGDHIKLMYCGRWKLVWGKFFFFFCYFFFFFNLGSLEKHPDTIWIHILPKQTVAAAGPEEGRGGRRLTAGAQCRILFVAFFFVLFCFLTATVCLSAGCACGEVISVEGRG